MIAAFLATAVVAATTPGDLEAAAQRQVALEYERVGRRTPVRDDALSQAARQVARYALAQNAQASADLVPLTEAVSFSEGWDASPRALVIKGSPANEPLKALLTRRDISTDSASHVGIGAVVKGEAAAVVLLFVQRKVKLEPFWRRPPKPFGSRPLCGTLEHPFRAPDVLVTRPDGTVDRADFSKVRLDGAFCADVRLDTQGRHTVEVLARGPQGPEVAALFFVDVGSVKKDQTVGVSEPRDPEVARATIVDRINALRKAHGLAPVSLDPELTKVADAYSRRMAKGRFFAHVAPEGDTVGKRLSAAGYPFRGAGENLGLASGPLSAHFGIEHSPGHRKNLLEKAWGKVGIGLAVQEEDGHSEILLTEIFVDPVQVSADPLGDAYRALATKRSELKLPALQRSEALERLARDHAKKALSLDDPKVDLPGEKLHERVFAAMDEVRSASVDFYVAETPALIDPSSKAMSDGKFGLVGIGAVKGTSPRFGKDKYWVVVIYASTR